MTTHHFAPEDYPAPTSKSDLCATFAANMMPQPARKPKPLWFKPAYGSKPDHRCPSGSRYFQTYAGKSVGRDPASACAGVLERAKVGIHEAAHLAGMVMNGSLITEAGICGASEKTCQGYVNSSSTSHPALKAFEVLLGVACEMELRGVVDRADDDMHSARSFIGETRDLPDDVPQVLEIASEFFRAARRPINFMASWLLVCSSLNGRGCGRDLTAITDAARPHILEIAVRLEIKPRLRAIQQRRDEIERPHLFNRPPGR